MVLSSITLKLNTAHSWLRCNNSNILQAETDVSHPVIYWSIFITAGSWHERNAPAHGVRLHFGEEQVYSSGSVCTVTFAWIGDRHFVFTGAELLAFYNHPPVREAQVKYYTVKVPLRVQNCDEGVKGVEANWLDHMTQHFNNGASLVDGYFYLGSGNGKLLFEHGQRTTIKMTKWDLCSQALFLQVFQ